VAVLHLQRIQRATTGGHHGDTTDDGPRQAAQFRAEAHRAHRQRPLRRCLGAPGPSKRDRSLITVAALIALNRTEQLRGHLERALGNGLTKDEIIEVITHLAFYSGWPTAMSAALLAKDALESRERG
jgi:alkylhydroperoxidase/carboxymuconolactone decarboxylase family protein YurZ